MHKFNEFFFFLGLLVLESNEKKSVGAHSNWSIFLQQTKRIKNALHAVGSRPHQGTSLQLGVD